MEIGSRSYSASGYRYLFNGKEKDTENGNVYDYGFRIYNPSLGKFLSVDPLTRTFPWYTPYQFAGNKPTYCIDLDGLEELETLKDIGNKVKPVLSKWFVDAEGKLVTAGKTGLKAGGAIFGTIVLVLTPADNGVSEHKATVGNYETSRFEELSNKQTNLSESEKHEFDYLQSKYQYDKEGKVVQKPPVSEAETILRRALRRQGVDHVPQGFKEEWSENGYDYEVRIHGPNPKAPDGSYSKDNSIYRVARRKQGKNENGEGFGWEYADDNNNWIHTKKLKQDNQSANDTHIKLPKE
jgi:RHS repeat-associated protein